MKTILFGLLQAFGGWLLVSGALSYFLQFQYGMRATDTIGIALFGGGFAWVSFGLFVSAFGRWREHAVLTGGIAGERPVDGKQAVLVGTLVPIGTPLRAPLDGTACALYAYEIRYDVGSGKQRSFGTLFRGVGLTPSRIVTRTGSYKLLTVPEIAPDQPPASSEKAIERFLEYASGTTFTDRTASAAERLKSWADDDGAYRSDVAYTSLENADTSIWILRQFCVTPGERVCLFGLYSEAKGGIVPSVVTPTRLIRGSADEVAATLRSQAITRSIIGILLASPLVIAFLLNR